MFRWISALLLLAVSSSAAATLDVVATTGSMGMLARVVGGDAVKVTVLAQPNRDARTPRARPHMLTSLNRADVLIAVGGGLESGWLPSFLETLHNTAIQPGQPGYFEAAEHVTLIPLEMPDGDPAELSNPYINLDPLRMATITEALAVHLGRLDSANAALYTERARLFAEQIRARMPNWRERVANAPGVLLYQQDANYLMHTLNVPILGYVHADPDNALTAQQLRELAESLQGKRGIVLQANYQHDRGARYVARQLGWPHRALSVEPPPNASGEVWLELIERWVDAIASVANP